MSLRFLRSLLFVFLVASAAGQSVGQYELRKRTSTGFTAYGVTLADGQVIGLTSGIPAPITPVVSGDLSAYLTTTAAASTYQPLDTQLSSLAALTDAAGFLSNNGTGGLAWDNNINVSGYVSAAGLVQAGGTSGNTIYIQERTMTHYHGIRGRTAALSFPDLASGSGNRSYLLPDNSTASTQTLVGSSDTGTVTNIMLAGSIDNSKLATDPLNASNLTSGTVPTARLGSGTANSTTYLRGDNTWQTISGSGVTSITGTANEITVTGTTTPTLSLPSALTFTGKTITGGTFSSPTLTTPALGTPSALVLTNATGSPTGISLTRAELNTIVSDDNPAYVGTAQTFTAAQTISTGSDVVTNLRIMNAAGSQPRVQLGTDPGSTGYGGLWMGNGTACAVVGDNLTTYLAGPTIRLSSTGNVHVEISSSVITTTSAGGINFSSVRSLSWNSDAYLYRAAANHIEQRNSTNAQAWRIANTYTSSTNNEFFVIDWQTTANSCRIGTVKGSGGGTARQLIIQTDGTERIRISASGEIFMTLPTSAGTTGSLWNDSGTVKVAP